jgi:hypothetical protein
MNTCVDCKKPAVYTPAEAAEVEREVGAGFPANQMKQVGL